MIAARREPAPESLVLVTVKVGVHCCCAHASVASKTERSEIEKRTALQRSMHPYRSGDTAPQSQKPTYDGVLCVPRKGITNVHSDTYVYTVTAETRTRKSRATHAFRQSKLTPNSTIRRDFNPILCRIQSSQSSDSGSAFLSNSV